jgi:hypothetical protein
VAREEAQGVQATPTGLEVGAPCFLVPLLNVRQVSGDTIQVAAAVFPVKGQRGDQRVRGVAYLAQGNGRVFPPAAASSGGPKKGDSPG